MQDEADGIIISRGNLGLDCEPEKMALVQKTVIQVWVGGGEEGEGGAAGAEDGNTGVGGGGGERER